MITLDGVSDVIAHVRVVKVTEKLVHLVIMVDL